MSFLVPPSHAETELRLAHGHFERAVPLLHSASRELANDTPEPDCVLDSLMVWVPDTAQETVARRDALHRLTRGNRKVNMGRIDLERGDSFVLDLAAGYRAQRVTGNNGNGRNGHAALTVKAIARALCPHLRQLADTDGPHPFAAFCKVHRLIAETPRRQLLSESVAHELGTGPFGLLKRLVADYEDARASVLAAPDALTTTGEDPAWTSRA